MKRKIAIYARQSVDKKDSLSIETQVEFCKNFINSKPTTEPIEVYFDKGYSGKNTIRPEFQRLLGDIRDDMISKIVVYKLDRISRNLLDFTSMYQEFENHKVEFCSVSETFDTSTATGRSMLKISMVFAEMERETIQMRVRDNYYQRIKTDGRWAGGPAPYGFINARTADGKPTLKVDEKEIEIVKYVFENYSYRPNISMGMICRELTSMGYKSRRKNGMFDNVTISRILQSPVYCMADEILYKYYQIRGIHFLNDEEDWNGTSSAHIVGKRVGNYNVRKYADLKEQSIYLTNFSGVIDSRTFINVQERLAQNEQVKKNNMPTNMKEFQGLLKCANCGYAVKMYTKPKLACYGATQLHCCNMDLKELSFDKLRKELGAEVQKNLDKIAMDLVQSASIQASKKERIEELKKEIDNLLEIAAKGGDVSETVYNKIETKQQEINTIELDLFLNKRVTDKLHINYSIPINYNRFSDEQKKSICMVLIERIKLHQNGDMEIKWKI
ncbi:MAG: recombinase family protein [Lachnospiraceae bacterium]|nr:recombinase family protein [Lachnospiraceae bacterium]